MTMNNKTLRSYTFYMQPEHVGHVYKLLARLQSGDYQDTTRQLDGTAEVETIPKINRRSLGLQEFVSTMCTCGVCWAELSSDYKSRWVYEPRLKLFIHALKTYDPRNCRIADYEHVVSGYILKQSKKQAKTEDVQWTAGEFDEGKSKPADTKKAIKARSDSVKSTHNEPKPEGPKKKKKKPPARQIQMEEFLGAISTYQSDAPAIRHLANRSKIPDKFFQKVRTPVMKQRIAQGFAMLIVKIQNQQQVYICDRAHTRLTNVTHMLNRNKIGGPENVIYARILGPDTLVLLPK